jgi:hypothetical protein
VKKRRVHGHVELHLTLPKKQVQIEDTKIFVSHADDEVYDVLHRFGWAAAGVSVICWINGHACKLKTISSEQLTFERHVCPVEAVASLEGSLP